MQATFNYLLRRHQPDTSAEKDGYVKAVVTGLGLSVGAGTIAYAAANVKSYITKENAQYCAIQALATLAEAQRQIQIFNASCVCVEPGSTMSMCDATLLPNPVNTSCTDPAKAGFINYVPIIVVAAGVAAFGLLMGRSMLASRDQRNEQNPEEWYFFKTKEKWQLFSASVSESDTLTEHSF